MGTHIGLLVDSHFSVLSLEAIAVFNGVDERLYHFRAFEVDVKLIYRLESL
jgi:hypothetical protein